MFVKFSHHHRVKVLVGVPVVFLFLFSGKGAGDPSASLLITEVSPTRFPAVGTTIFVDIIADVRSASNAVGGIVRFDPNILVARSISLDNTIVDIWAESPTIDNTNGAVRFTGGFLRESGYAGRGKVFTVEFLVIAPQPSNINITGAEILANDGIGTNRAAESSAIRIFPHDEHNPNIDQNGDGRLSLLDAQIIYFSTFRAYDSQRDVTRDGRVSWADVSYILSLVGE